MFNFLCFVAFYTVLLQNLSFMRFTLFCREICFVAIHALWRGEKLSKKFYLWRKKDKYEVCLTGYFSFSVSETCRLLLFLKMSPLLV